MVERLFVVQGPLEKSSANIWLTQREETVVEVFSGQKENFPIKNSNLEIQRVTLLLVVVLFCATIPLLPASPGLGGSARREPSGTNTNGCFQLPACVREFLNQPQVQ